ncbi:DUF6325 family protein [Jatrophihabitans sp. DSM 45814]
MALRPVEIIVIGFPVTRMNERVVPALRALIDRGSVNVVDAMLIKTNSEGDVEIIELEQADLDPALKEYRMLVGQTVYDVVSAEDVQAFGRTLEHGSSAAVLAFEYKGTEPLGGALVGNGEIVTNIRISGRTAGE